MAEIINADLQARVLKPSEDQREVIEVVDGEPRVRAVIRSVLEKALPGYSIIEDNSCLRLIEKIADGTAGDVALVILEAEDPWLKAFIDIKGERTRLVATLNDAERDLASISEMIEGGQITETLQKPFGSELLKSTVSEILERRTEDIALIRAEKREACLIDFISRYKPLIEKALHTFKALDFLREGRGDFVEYSKEADMESIVESLGRVLEFFDKLETLARKGKELDTAELRGVFHDINNVLQPIMMTVPIRMQEAEKSNLGDPEYLDPETMEVLKELDLELSKILVREIKEMATVNTENRSWAPPAARRKEDVAKSRADGPSEQVEGDIDDAEMARVFGQFKFLVIDDGPNVLKTLKRALEIAGASSVETANRGDILMAVERLKEKKSGRAVILLDNNLGEGTQGHIFIEPLRGAIPGVIIIANTSDSVALNDKPDNPYAKAGVPVLAKIREREDLEKLVRLLIEMGVVS